MNGIALRNKLIKQTIILVLALGVLAGVAYYLSVTFEEYTNEYNGLAGSAAAATGEVSTLEDKFGRVKQYRALYDEVTAKITTNALSLDRDFVRKRFNTYKTKYLLENLRLSMTPSQELTGMLYKRPSGGIISSDVTLDFDALTDEDVYELIRSIYRDFPGAVKFTQCFIARKSDVTGDSLRAISKDGKRIMVQGTLKFTWYGIKVPEPTTPNPANPNAANAIPRIP